MMDYFLILFLPTGWMLFSLLLGHPWRRLASDYPASREVSGHVIRTTLGVDWSGHKHAYLTSAHDGILLRVSLIDSLFHRHLFVPWQELEVAEVRQAMLGRIVFLKPSRRPASRITLPEDAWDEARRERP